MALPCSECHGAGPDDDPGHVEQGLLPQTAAPLHFRRHQEMHREGQLSLCSLSLSVYCLSLASDHRVKCMCCCCRELSLCLTLWTWRTTLVTLSFGSQMFRCRSGHYTHTHVHFSRSLSSPYRMWLVFATVTPTLTSHMTCRIRMTSPREY